MERCLFCEIIKENDPARKIAESETVLVYLEDAGDVDGHMIIVPKKHVKNLIDCEFDLLMDLMTMVKELSIHCVDNCGFDGINLIKADDETMLSPSKHLHFHIIPRKKNDGLDAWPFFTGAKQKLTDMHLLLKMEDTLKD